MYQVKRQNFKYTTAQGVQGYKGETIEQKMQRVVNSKEPITDGAPLIYTERKDGVNPDLDPRTDKWEHAVEAMSKVAKTQITKRNKIGDKAKEGMEKEKATEKPTPTPGAGEPKGEGGA